MYECMVLSKTSSNSAIPTTIFCALAEIRSFASIKKWLFGPILDKENTGRWNGRQIRNAFQTAIALAEWDLKTEKTKTAKLTRACFEKVDKASREFDKYLRDTHGGANEGERAQEMKERLENWDVKDSEDAPKKKKKKGKKAKDSEDDSEKDGDDSDE
ncbi:hypothetical protein BDR22DRAFT_885171 [Usnea florida]